MTRLLVPTLALGAFLGAALSPAAAEPVPNYFGPLLTEVQNRIAAIPDPPTSKDEKKQLKALKKVSATLQKSHRKPGFGIDAKAAASADKTLGKVFPLDGVFDNLLDDLADDIALGLDHRLDHMETGFPATLPEGKTLSALAALVDKSRSYLTLYSGAGTRAQGLKYLKSGGKTSDKAPAKFLKAARAEMGTKGIAATEGSPFAIDTVDANVIFSADETGIVHCDITGNTGEDESFRLVQISLDTGGGSGMAPGDSRTLGAGPDHATYSFGGATAQSASGSCTVLFFDGKSALLVGTFAFSGDFDTSGTADVTDGRFVIQGIQYTTQP